MDGTVVKINKAASKIFTILGDDGVEYFGHFQNLSNKKEWSHYFYKSSRCSFDFVDEGKAHLKAVNIISDGKYDPLAEERKRRADEAKLLHEQKVKKKEARKAVEEGQMNLSELSDIDSGFVKHIRDLERHKRNKAWDEYVKEKGAYAVQIRKEGGWEFLFPLMYSKSLDEAKAFVTTLKKDHLGNCYRIRKCTIHTVGGKTIAKELRKVKHK